MEYDTIKGSVHPRIINAFFDHQTTAQKAVEDLISAGISRQDITQTGGESTVGEIDSKNVYEEKGFWESLKDIFIPEEDRYTYAEGLRRGGYLVSVKANEVNYDRVLDILDNDGSIDLDERESQWRSEGWSGYADRPSAERTTTVAHTPQTAYDATATAEGATLASAPVASYAAGAAPLVAGQEEVVQLYEENLTVGKRDVNHGRVRLRSYVVETPVSEQVSLRDEKVVIDRKPVDRPVAVGDAAFQERVIEVEEHAEEAVIAKEARVTEEISLRKTAENQTRTITDTVRHTEVEVEDDRKAGLAKTSSGFAALTDAALIREHMEVISSDGQKIGTVDHLDGPDQIKLAKNTSPDGQHHLVPFAWIDHVDQHVHLKKTLTEVKAAY